MRKLQTYLIVASSLAAALAVVGCSDGGDSFGTTDFPSMSLSNSNTVRLNLPSTEEQMKAQREVTLQNSGDIDLEVESIEWVARPDQLRMAPGYIEDSRCEYDASEAPTYDASDRCPDDSVCWALNGECRQTGIPELPLTIGPDKTYSFRTILLPKSTALRCPEQPEGQTPVDNYCGELRVKTNANTNDEDRQVEEGEFSIIFVHTEGSGTLSPAPQTLNFSGVAPGDSTSVDLTLSNVHADKPLTIRGLKVLDQENLFDISQTPALPAEINPGSENTWTITFQPPADWDGEDFGTNLAVETSENPGTPTLIPIDVSATAPMPSIQLEPSAMDFSSQTTQTLTVSNEGGTNLVINGFSTSPSSYYSVEPDASTAVVVRPGESEEFQVSFDYPADEPAGGVGTLEVHYNYFVAGTNHSDSATVTLLGNIGDAPLGMVSPQALDFHAASGASAARSFVLRNLGSQPLEISDFEITETVGSADSFSTTLSPGTTLAPGAIQAVEVNYSSSDDEDDRSALRLTTNTAGSDLFVTLIADAGEAADTSAEITPAFGDDSLELGEPAEFNALSSSGYEDSDLRTGQWILLERPADSAAFLDKTGDRASFLPDVAGDYTVSYLVGTGPKSNQASYTFSVN